MSRKWWIIPTLFIGLCAPQGAWAACSAFSNNYAVYTGPTANLKVEQNVRVNGTKVTQTDANTPNAILPSAALTTVSETVPDFDPASFPTLSGTTKTTAGTLSENDYDEIDVAKNTTGTLNAGTYFINKLEINEGATLNLNAGTYYIDELKLEKNSNLVVQSGPVKIYIGDKVDISGQNVDINVGGSAGDLAFFLYDNTEFKEDKNTDFTGFVFGKGSNSKIQFGENSNITGGIFSEGEVTLKKNIDITYGAAQQTAASNTSTCLLPVADYHFDECSYSGTAGEVIDSTGNYNAQAYNGVSTASPGQVERFLDATSNTHHFRSSGVPITRSWTVSVWFKMPINTTHRYHIIGAIDGGGDLLFLDRNQNFRWGVYNPGNIQYGSFRLGTLSSGWHHLTLVARYNTTQLYIDGVLRDSVNLTTKGTLRYLGTSFDNVNNSNAQGFGAGLDEYRVYHQILTPASINALYTNQAAGNNADGTTRTATACNVVDHFDIDLGSGTASTCSAREVTIVAKDSSNNTINFAGDITISTSSNHGDWSTTDGSGNSADPVNGSFANSGGAAGSTDDGLATYSFVAGDSGSIALYLTNTHADDLTVTVSSTTPAVSSTSGAISFRDNAFVITPADSLGSEIVAGRDHDFKAELWRRDTSTGDCAIASNYNNTGTAIKAWLTRDSDDPGATAPTINAVGLPNSAPGTGNVTPSFSNGVWNFTLNTTDVGKYVLNLRDDATGFAVDTAGSPLAIDGASSTLTTRPFGLALTTIQAGATANPGSNTPAGSIFTCAGCNFTTTVTAVRWQAADDTDNNGIPDNAVDLGDNTATAGFAWDTSLTSNAPFEPSTGVLGGLNNGSLASSSFASGSSTPANLQYTEVGSFTLDVSVTNFLNTSGVNVGGNGGSIVGRFTPDHFATSLSTPQFATACAGGSYTYSGEPFVYNTPPVITATARNALNNQTQNYTGSWFKLSVGQPASNLSWSYSAASGTLDTGTVADPMIAETSSDPNTTATITFSAGSPGIAFNRAQSAPFDADIALTVQVIDEDNIAASSNPVSFGSATAGNGMAFDNGKEIRFGRLKLVGAFGSELLPVNLPLVAEYYDGSAYITNTGDSCSTYNSSNLSCSDPDTSDSLVCANITASGSGTLAGGSATIGLAGSTPTTGPGNTGQLDYTYDIEPWLHYDWDNDGNHDNDPAARVTFGIFKGSDNLIYQRDMYRD